MKVLKLLFFCLLLAAIPAISNAESVTVTQTTFSATSGNVDDDNYVSFLAEKGSASTAPALNNGEIRVYQSGGLFTVSAKSPAKIKSIVLGSNMNTTIQYKNDNGSFNGSNISITKGGTYTHKDLDVSSVTFKCTGTSSSSRLYVNYLSVTYELPSTAEVTELVISGQPEVTEIKTGQTINPAGINVTANFDDNTSNPDFAGYITADNWHFNPSTFETVGTVNVEAYATYNGVTSNTINFPVTVTEIPRYELVTDVTALKTGDKIVLIDVDHETAMSTTQQSSNRTAVSVSGFSDDYSELSLTNEEVQVITLEKEASTGFFSFNVGDGYLYASSSSKNELKVQTSLNANGKAFITIDSTTGATTIQFQGENTRNTLQKNSNSLIFSCYNSAQKAVLIYRLVTNEEEETKVLTGIVVEGDAEDLVQGQEFSHNGITVIAQYDDQSTKDVTNLATYTNYDMTQLGQQTVNVSYTENEVTFNGSYSVNVVAPHYCTIAEFNELADGTTVTMDEVVVIAQYQNNLYVKDNTGYMLIYGIVDQEYNQGDIIPAGFQGNKTTYSYEPELENPVSSSFAPATKTAEVVAEELSGVDMVGHDYFGHYFVANNITFNASTQKFVLENGAEIDYYDKFNKSIPTDNKHYNVYGILGSTKKNNAAFYNILPWKFEEATYTVSLSPVYSTITVMNGETPVVDGDKVPSGSVLTVTATAEPGFAVTKIEATDADKYEEYTSDGGTFTVTNSDVLFSSEVALAPVLTPAPGKYTEAQTITVTNLNEDLVYCYMVNDGVQTDLNEGDEIAINKSCTITIDALDNDNCEFNYVANYTINTLPTPVLEPAGGEYKRNVKVKINNYVDSDDFIYTYTLDGSDPTRESTTYDDYDGILLTESCTLKVIATNMDENSDVAVGEYTIHPDHTVTVAECENGDLMVNVGKGKYLHGGESDTVEHGTKIQLLASSNNPDYRLIAIVVDDGNTNVIYHNYDEYTVTSDVTISAEFEPIPPSYPVTIVQPERGYIQVMKGNNLVQDGSNVDEGTVLTITASADEGYRVDCIKVNGEILTGDTYTVTGPTTITAVYKRVLAPATATIVWKGSTTDQTSTLSASTLLETNTIEGDEYVTSYDDVANVYEGKFDCLKFSSSKNTGKMTINLDPQTVTFNPTSITINAAQYSSSEKALNVKINGQTYTINNLTATLADYTINLDGTPVTSIEITNSKRFYLKSITLEGTPTPARVLDHIEISGLYRTKFDYNEELSHKGLVVKAYYEDDVDPVDVTELAQFVNNETGQPFTAEELNYGPKTVRVSYTEGGFTETATYDIRVQDRILVNITYKWFDKINGKLEIKDRDNGETIFNNTQVLEGTILTIKATPEHDHWVKNIAVFDVNNIKQTFAGNEAEVVVGDCDMAIGAEYILAPKYHHTWYVNGKVLGTCDKKAEGYQLVIAGDSVKSLQAPETLQMNGVEKKFMGWVETERVDANTAPTYVIPETISTGNKIYYAVYATATTVGNDTVYSDYKTVEDDSWMSLRYLVDHATDYLNQKVTLIDQLEVTYMIHNKHESSPTNMRYVMLLKDRENLANPVVPENDTEPYLIHTKSNYQYRGENQVYNEVPQEEYNQSNWIEVVCPDYMTSSTSLNMEAYNNRILNSQAVYGTLVDAVNPRIVFEPESYGVVFDYINDFDREYNNHSGYYRNAMTPVNFMGTSQVDIDGNKYFFMTPKNNELVQIVWAIYDKDTKSLYCPNYHSGDNNPHHFTGCIKVGSWEYNAFDPSQLVTNLCYQFDAVVKKRNAFNDVDIVEKYKDDPVFAPRKASEYSYFFPEMCEDTSDFVIWPLGFSVSPSVVTGVDGVNENHVVESVMYYNLQGAQFDSLQPGLNIVVTRYNDGTSTSCKIMK